ncbi:MAG: serpin family protein [Chitinispirillaceae bacterium]|nr:serpin family protein [Chitinispirillaceae bacterium]
MSYKKLLGLAAAIAIVGCSENPVSENNDDTGSPKFIVHRSQSAVREAVASDDNRISVQAASNNEFASKMYSQLAESQNGNLFFSPFSIVSALGMADAGARGGTDLQIRKALSIQLPADDFHAALNGLDQSIESHAATVDNLEFKNVNSIWSHNGQGFALKMGYLDKMELNYGAGVNLLNFSEKTDSSRIIINDWVSEQTNNRINDLLPDGSINGLTRVVLTNAIYFLADWKVKFDVSRTKTETFTRKDGSAVSVPMMTLGDSIVTDEKVPKHLYGRVDSTRILELPYSGDRLVMDILLPDLGAFDYFERKLSRQMIDTLINSLNLIPLPPVKIPRFEFSTSSISLKNALVAMGMEDAFSETDADFSGMSETFLYVSDVVHKAFIKVNENGTEAAAATGVVFATTSVSAPKIFIADRPFIYLIRDTQTKSILFMGRVLDPTITK